MKIICLDTSLKYLVIGLIENGKVVGSYQEECLKKQSELMLEKIDSLCVQYGWNPSEIEGVVISKGPGSYTGVRIAMTFAKMFCSMRKVSLYTVSTLQLYAGLEDVAVVMDARSARVYYGRYQNGSALQSDCVISIDEAIQSVKGLKVIGDGELVNKEVNYPNVVDNFLALKDHWILNENPHNVTPEYLKENTEYLSK